MRQLTATLALMAAAAGLVSACSSGTDEGTGGLTDGESRNGGAGPSTGGTGSTGHVIVMTGGSSGTSGSSGTTSSSSGGSGAADCTGTTTTGQKGDGAVVLFVVDTSLSMSQTPGGGRGGGTTGQTKMQATQTALNQAFDGLSSGLNVGLVFYPHVEFGSMPCFDPTMEVPIAELDDTQLTTLKTAVTAAKPDGSTPTHDAYAFAVQTLEQTAVEGAKYIVLITDGAPTYALDCKGDGKTTVADNQPLVAAAQAAYTSDGIKTFVVGSPGSEQARGTLSALARVGGTGPAGCSDGGMPYCHFDMTASMDFAGSLSLALGEIAQQIPVDCAFDLPRPPAGMQLDLGLVNVTVTNDDGSKAPIAKDPAGDCATDGWVYVGDPPTQVKLCGTLCDSVKAQGTPSIDVQFGCSTRVNPPR